MSGTESKLPPEIQEACKIMGLSESELTTIKITDAWKTLMFKHIFCEDDTLVIANDAKKTLLRWVQRFD